MGYSVYRFPGSGNTETTGENIIELAIYPGAKARQVKVTVTGDNAEVFVNDRPLLPERKYGAISEYFARHVAQCLTSEGKIEIGKIESLIVKGDGVKFFAEISG